ncbi:TetR/AcrR family transcriptional regulator [Paenarthrobacter sp. NPDC089675]|uniref:TetR/AcrR family transcriptional regulator n=1 Tax=Paenarthrobacter sp. NPDC089675 TaxID=3364376 RepID=UPI0037F82B02
MPEPVGLIDKSGLRRDALRSVGQLLNATGALLRLDPAGATMQAIAERANVSVATAYRYFPTLQQLHTEFLYSVLVNARDYSLACQLNGKELFLDTTTKWVQILAIYGKALSQIRSPQGFLDRLDRGDITAVVVFETWERPIREALREIGVSERHFRHALLLFNSLFHSREVIDLHETEGFSADEIANLLAESFYGAVQGWARGSLSTQVVARYSQDPFLP